MTERGKNAHGTNKDFLDEAMKIARRIIPLDEFIGVHQSASVLDERRARVAAFIILTGLIAASLVAGHRILSLRGKKED